jgi:hypothetical protein
MMVVALALYLHAAAAAASPPSLEAVVKESAARVQNTFGTGFTLIEAFACAEYQCARRAPMHSAAAAGFMRLVFTKTHQTAPNVAAFANISETGVQIALEWHDVPFIQDNYTAGFPPASGDTFESVFRTLTSKAGAGALAWQVTFRRPLHPCVTEDSFQCSLVAPVLKNGSQVDVVSLGVTSSKLCAGFVTEHVEMAMCPEPDCWP